MSTKKHTKGKQVKLTDMLQPKPKDINGNEGDEGDEASSFQLKPVNILSNNESSEKSSLISKDINGASSYQPKLVNIGESPSPSNSDVQIEKNIADAKMNMSSAPTDLTPIDSLDRNITSSVLKNFSFPKSTFQNRSFQLKWLDLFQWLEYSVSRNAAFCFPCRAFNISCSKDYTFTITGFTNWKKALDNTRGFYYHEKSQTHVSAIYAWEERRKRDLSKTEVTELLSSTVLQKRRFYLKSIIEVIKFVIENELSLRGNWDMDEHKECGVFRNLFEFKLRDSEELRACQTVMPKNATYLSPEIQNELISIIAKMIRDQVVNEVKSADVQHFTLLVDGTKDRKNCECVSIAVRYVLHGQLKESLLSLETLKKFDAESNANLALSTLTGNGLSLENILSQCYDGASVMSGDNAGVQTIIQEKLDRIIPYIHCFNHRLHLVVIAAIDNVDLARIFFDNVKLVYTFFHRAKIQAVYKGKAILNVIEIRWAGHVRATNVIFDNLKEIDATLSEIQTQRVKTEFNFDADDIAMAIGIQTTIRKHEFIFMLVFMKEFLNLISPADKILQSRDVGFREAMPVIESVLSEVLALRSEPSFERIYKFSEEIFAEMNVNYNARPTRTKTRSVMLSSYVITDKVGERNNDATIEIKSSYYAVIDRFESEMKERFYKNSDILLAISESSEFNLGKLQPLKKIGIKLPSKEELSVAKKYIDRQKELHEMEKKKNKEDKETFKDRFDLLGELYKMREAFPDVYNMMASCDVFGSSTTICECSFSALERIGQKKRINMTNERLRDLSFLAFEKKRLHNLDIDAVMKTFNKNPSRRLQLY